MTTTRFRTRPSRTAHTLAVGSFALACAALAPRFASADVVTGTVSPASAKVVLVDATGKTVAELKPGAYQVQLPVGKYQARCSAPKEKTVDVLVLSEPVTLNVDCG
jgi:hypothetical protein